MSERTALEPANDVVTESYLAMWTCTEPEERRRLVEAAFTPDAVFCDPLGEATGHDAIAEVVVNTQEQFPDCTFRLDSGIDQHHARLRYRWLMLDAEGKTMLEGHDAALLAPDGRLARVDGFFGPLPEVG